MYKILECYKEIGYPTKLIQTVKDGSIFELYDCDKFIGIITMNEIQEFIESKQLS